MIESIEISGFRVFSGEKRYRIPLIPDGFILIGGLNALGKTSIYQSLRFAFAGNKDSLSRSKIKGLVNYNSNTSYAMVQVQLKNRLSDGSIIFPGINENKVIIERVIGKYNSDNDYIRVNGNVITASDLRSMLRQAHIDADNPYQFVGQGQLATIITKSLEERLKLLDIFIPATETAKNFLNGLRKIRRVNRSLQELEFKKVKYIKEELEARKIRDQFEKKKYIENKLKEANALWAYAKEQELLEKKENAYSDLTESQNRIEDFTKQIKNKSRQNELLKEELKKEISKKEELESQRNTSKSQIKEFTLQKNNLEIKIARISNLELELKNKEYVALKEAERICHNTQNRLTKLIEEKVEIESKISELKNQKKLLDNKINKPLSVLDALKIAEAEEIEAVYTFENTEWKIDDEIEKKRLETILTPFKESITVLSFKDAKYLFEKGVKIPILIAHSIGENCKTLEIKGLYNEYRSTIIEKIQQEWSPLLENFEQVYKRQVLSVGYVVNLSYIDKYDYQPFIGTEAIKLKKENINKKLSNYQDLLNTLGKNEKILQSEMNNANEITEIAKNFEELYKLKKENTFIYKKIDKLNSKIANLEDSEEKIYNSIIKSSNKIALLNKETEDLEKEINKFNKSIKEHKKKQPNYEQIYSDLKNLHKTHLDTFFEIIKLGQIINKNKNNIGTSSALKEDINRLEEELEDIDDVPEDAVEKHDKAKKRLEWFKIEVQKQNSTIDINPEKVKEDIHQYEQALRQFINKINKNLDLVLDELGGEAKFILTNIGLNDSTWEYNPGLKIHAKFKGKKVIEVDKDCSLSGGEKTRLVIGILIALIRSQEERHSLPFLILDEFDAQLDEPGHKKVMELLKKEVGAKQLLILSPNRLKDKALVADMILLFTNKPEMEPEIKIMAIRKRQ